ncbi:hypothetical protein BSIN_2939 [Burkholderia singularis]|uniref:Uncharacterized protein n=1 Tax=Burkholderia singularis TaxID=1503053 RepID=A0A238H3Y9_9BURK|nr:hypothetical protein BSIN_2939 [Burkholderia singularis]
MIPGQRDNVSIARYQYRRLCDRNDAREQRSAHHGHGCVN